MKKYTVHVEYMVVTLQVAGSTSKADFACGVIRGLGGNLSLADRNAFAKEVSPCVSKRGVGHCYLV